MQNASGGLPLQDQVLYLGSCSDDDWNTHLNDNPIRFPGTIGDIQIYEDLLSTEAASSLLGINGAEYAPPDIKLLFAMASVPEIAELLKVISVPARSLGAAFDDETSARSELFSQRMSGFVTCNVPSPALHSLENVAKPASITVMTWIQLASLPKEKEACVLSHGSWEHGWKLSM